MRYATAALSFALLAVACSGCVRSAPALNDVNATPTKPDARVQKPVAVDSAPTAPLGEDEHGKSVSNATLDTIKLSLKHPDPGVRLSAVKNLGAVRWKLPDPVGEILTLALGDADPDVRLEAVRVAARDPLRAADMARLLPDKDSRVRLAAAQALVALGKHEDDAYPILTAVLADRKATDRQAVLEQIRSKAAASRPATEALIAMALDPSDPLRAEAIGVLGCLRAAQESVDGLLFIAHDAEPKARAAALRALARLDPTSAKVQVALVKAVRDPNVEVQLAATDGVGRDGVPTLIELLRQNNEGLRDASARALGRIGPDAWAAGADLQRLAQSDPAERVRVTARTALNAIVPVADFK